MDRPALNNAVASLVHAMGTLRTPGDGAHFDCIVSWAPLKHCDSAEKHQEKLCNNAVEHQGSSITTPCLQREHCDIAIVMKIFIFFSDPTTL